MSQVRIGAIGRFNDQMKELNCNPADALNLAGLPETFFDEHTSDDMIGVEKIEVLLNAAVQVSQCPHFGALLGIQPDISFLGLIGYVMKQSSDVRTALHELIKHFTMHIREGAYVELQEFNEFGALNFLITDSPEARQSSELAIAECMSIMKTMCGANWKPTIVNFSHSGKDNDTPYRKIFGAPVQFNQEKNQVLFLRSDLDLPIAQADPELNRILRSYMESIKTDSGQDIQGQVEKLIRRTLPEGKCSVDHIAGLMAMHRRTLHRILKTQNTSYTILLENVRKGIAQDRLQNSNISIIQLAGCLGYTDNSAFTRAFTRWYKTTPQQWRKQNRDASQNPDE